MTITEKIELINEIQSGELLDYQILAILERDHIDSEVERACEYAMESIKRQRDEANEMWEDLHFSQSTI